MHGLDVIIRRNRDTASAELADAVVEKQISMKEASASWWSWYVFENEILERGRARKEGGN